MTRTASLRSIGRGLRAYPGRHVAGEDWQRADVHFPERRAGNARGCDRRSGCAAPELEAKGVPVKEGSWGYRLVVVDDPDGNQLFCNYPNETASGKTARDEA